MLPLNELDEPRYSDELISEIEFSNGVSQTSIWIRIHARRVGFSASAYAHRYESIADWVINN